MYREVGGHVSVLAASVRDIRHLLTSFQHGADIVTAPAGLLREWGGSGMALSPAGQRKHISLTPIAYESWDLEKTMARFF